MRHTHSKVPLPGRTTLHSRLRTLRLSHVEKSTHPVGLLLDDDAYLFAVCNGSSRHLNFWGYPYGAGQELLVSERMGN